MNELVKRIVIHLPVLKKQYEDKERLRREVAEVEAHRASAYRQRDEMQAEMMKVYDAHTKMESEINFLKFRLGEVDEQYDRIVDRYWREDGDWTRYTCRLPFERIEILPRGEVYTCCSAHLKNGYSIGNLFEDSMEEIWNSDRAKRLRYSVTCGRFEYCQDKCLLWMNRDKDVYPVVKRREDESPTRWEEFRLDRGPVYISLSCDESCNLYCRSCRCERKILDRRESDRLLETLTEKVRPMLEHCRRLDLLGSGEVFASRACMGFLQSLDASELPDLSIGLISNGTLFTPQNWEKLRNLWGRSISVAISIDAAEKETYESLRLGGRWEALCENLSFIGGLRKSGRIEHFSARFVVQRENYRQMEKFVALAKEWNADQVEFLGLDNWGTYEEDAYIRMNVMHPDNPCHEEARALLRKICTETKDLQIYQNIMDLQ